MTMKKYMLYLIGEPGSGKTTLVDRMTKGVPSEVYTVPYVSYTEYTGTRALQLGYRRETFGGTDALGMAAQNHVLEWLEEDAARFILAEGDRLANGKFFTAVQEMGFNLEVVLLDVPQDILESRREKRNAKIGKAQNAQWLKTRQTKVANLARDWVNTTINATQKPSVMLSVLADNPVVKEIARGRV